LCSEYSDAAANAVLESPYPTGLQHLRLVSEQADLSAEGQARFRARFGVAHPNLH
jgi:hypothetical protein